MSCEKCKNYEPSDQPRDDRGRWVAEHVETVTGDKGCSVEVIETDPTEPQRVTIAAGPWKGTYVREDKQALWSVIAREYKSEIARLEHLIKQHKAAQKTAEAALEKVQAKLREMRWRTKQACEDARVLADALDYASEPDA
jgi:hypothetical protein